MNLTPHLPLIICRTWFDGQVIDWHLCSAQYASARPLAISREGIPPAESCEIMEEICKRANSHAQLVEALKYWIPKEQPFAGLGISDPICDSHIAKWNQHRALLSTLEESR